MNMDIPGSLIGNARNAFCIPFKEEIAMSGTYSDPKGHKWHTPGKVDHDPNPPKDVLEDGNGSPTKIGTETLVNGHSGENTRGLDQVNISATPVQQTDRHNDLTQTDHTAPDDGSTGQTGHLAIVDERLAKGLKDDDPNNKPAPSYEREQRQYPEGHRPAK